MNDRYLFRGKRIDNGEWVVGNLSQWNDGDVFIVRQYHQFDKEQYKVIPETVGQCTGLKDKNGKLIFEGDILLFTNDDGEKTPYKVRWFEKYAGYIITTNDGATDTMDCWGLYGKYYEIVGNVTDNPELLHPDTSADEIAEIKYKYGFRGEEQAIYKIEKACKIACNAMEKQIPQKVIYGYDEQDDIKCPNCDYAISYMDAYDKGIDKHCSNCGQALDWGDEE